MSELSKPPTEKPEPPTLWAVIAVIAGIASLVATFSISDKATRWQAAEKALNQWHPVIGRIDQIEEPARPFRRRFRSMTKYIIISGTYQFSGTTHRFQTNKLNQSDLWYATDNFPAPGAVVPLHIDPHNPSESVFDAKAQVEIFRPQTMNVRFLALSCGLLSLIGISIQFYERRCFAKKFPR